MTKKNLGVIRRTFMIHTSRDSPLVAQADKVGEARAARTGEDLVLLTLTDPNKLKGYQLRSLDNGYEMGGIVGADVDSIELQRGSFVSYFALGAYQAYHPSRDVQNPPQEVVSSHVNPDFLMELLGCDVI